MSIRQRMAGARLSHTLASDIRDYSEDELNDESFGNMAWDSFRMPKSKSESESEDEDYTDDMEREIEYLAKSEGALRQELDSIRMIPDAPAVTSPCFSSSSSSASMFCDEDSIKEKVTVDNNEVAMAMVNQSERPTCYIGTSSVHEEAQNDVSKGYSKNTQAEISVYEPMQDTFSLMFICNIDSHGFYYSLFFFALQFAILFLISFNILKGAPDGNMLNVPVRTSLDVILAQAFGLFVSLITQSDFMATFDLINVKYDDAVLSLFEGATHTKWIISNLCRYLEGVFSVAISFIFIVQSTTVIELFFNFAAVQFVSTLDNIAFELAYKGYMVMGDLEQTARKLINQVQFRHRKKLSFPRTKIRIPVKWLRLAIFSVHALILYSAWFVVRYRQANGQYLQFSLESGCQSFEVRFDAELTNRCREPSCFGLYGAFSDFYEVSRTDDGNIDRIGFRPVYYQRDDKGFVENKFTDTSNKTASPPGKFSYCESEKAWVFTIATLKKEKGDTCNWLLRSPKTDAYSLGDVPTTGWSIWLNNELVSADPLFEISCLRDCESDVDCNFHGTCNNEVCICNATWTGRRCQAYACDPLLSYSIGVNGDTKEKTQSDAFFNLKATYHDRPVYYYNDTKSKSTEIVFYSYGRFNVGTFDIDPDMDNYTGKLEEYFNNFHDWWHDALLQDTLTIKWSHTFVSQYTTANMPTSGFASKEEVTWKDDWPNPGKTIMFECKDPYDAKAKVSTSSDEL